MNSLILSKVVGPKSSFISANKDLIGIFMSEASKSFIIQSNLLQDNLNDEYPTKVISLLDVSKDESGCFLLLPFIQRHSFDTTMFVKTRAVFCNSDRMSIHSFMKQHTVFATLDTAINMITARKKLIDIEVHRSQYIKNYRSTWRLLDLSLELTRRTTTVNIDKNSHMTSVLVDDGQYTPSRPEYGGDDIHSPEYDPMNSVPMDDGQYTPSRPEYGVDDSQHSPEYDPAAATYSPSQPGYNDDVADFEEYDPTEPSYSITSPSYKQ